MNNTEPSIGVRSGRSQRFAKHRVVQPFEDTRVTFIAVPYARIARGRIAQVVVCAQLGSLLLYFLGFGDFLPVSGTVLVAYVLALPFAHSRARKALRRACALEFQSKLVCEGSLEDLTSIDGLDDAFLEPYIAQDMDSYQTPVRAFVTVCIAVGCIAFMSYRWPTPATAFLITFIAVAIHFYASFYIFPMYYRLTPSTLEILKYQPFGRQNAGHTIISLRHAALHFDFKNRVLSIMPDNPHEEEIRLRLGGVWDLRFFARATFSAALCNHSAPVLSADELLG